MYRKILLWIGLLIFEVDTSMIQVMAEDRHLIPISALDGSMTSIFNELIYTSSPLKNRQDRKRISVNQNKILPQDSYIRLAIEKYKRKDYQGTLADLNRAIQLDSRNAFAYSSRGFLKAEKLQDYQGALADFDRAIQLDPNNGLAYHNRGNLKANKLQDIRGGLNDYNRAIQLDSQNAIYYSYRGALKSAKLRDQRGALVDLNRAIQVDPNCAVAHQNRAILKYEYLNDRGGGIIDIKKRSNYINGRVWNQILFG